MQASEEERFRAAHQHFDEGEYFEAHEVWEDLWNEAYGPRHAFLQCLIQTAVALHHAGNGNFRGAHKLLASALSYLEKGRSDSDPVDVDALKEGIVDFELGLQAQERGESTPLPYFKLPVNPY